MFTFLDQISFIRYLIVWRVNSSLAFLPRYLSIDISYVIGTTLAERLPSSQKTVWKKALQPNKISGSKHQRASDIKTASLLNIHWPIDAVLFTYPGKRSYGRDELIFWELKLFGEAADHGVFLELILPAMEAASMTSDPQWNQRNRLWGHFDVLHVFAAKGNRWEPVVKDGRLDLRYRPTPFQWREQLSLTGPQNQRFKRLAWMSPFDLSDIMFRLNKFQISFENRPLFHNNAPTLAMVMASLLYRLQELQNKRKKPMAEIGDFLSPAERDAFHQVLNIASPVAVTESRIRSVPKKMPGKWFGVQRFYVIPPAVIPYLELASIFHIGSQTHFGCGTFMLF